MVTRRRGASSLGCLFSLLIGAVVIYFGINVGEAYWRYYQFQDDMRQEVRFAANATNDAILDAPQGRRGLARAPRRSDRHLDHAHDKTISVESEYSSTSSCR